MSEPVCKQFWEHCRETDFTGKKFWHARCNFSIDSSMKLTLITSPEDVAYAIIAEPRWICCGLINYLCWFSQLRSCWLFLYHYRTISNLRLVCTTGSWAMDVLVKVKEQIHHCTNSVQNRTITIWKFISIENSHL